MPDELRDRLAALTEEFENELIRLLEAGLIDRELENELRGMFQKWIGNFEILVSVMYSGGNPFESVTRALKRIGAFLNAPIPAEVSARLRELANPCRLKTTSKTQH